MPEITEEIKAPTIDLTGQTIPAEVLKEISEEAASFYGFVPIKRENDILSVGMIEPDNLRSREALRFIAQRRKFKPKIYQISPTDFKNVLKQYRTLKEEIEKALKELEAELKEEEKGVKLKPAKPSEVAERVMTEAPVTKMVAVILKHALEGQASDIHIEPVEDKVKVRFRVDGVLYAGLMLPKDIQSAVISRVKILANLKIDETRIPQDGRFHSVIDGKKIDFRVSTFPTTYGEKVALRLLDPTVGLRTFEQAGLRGRNLRMIQEGAAKPFGMILATGPTGSGKTTTLYSILRILNQEGVNIVSLEDPVEYYIEGINQSQVRPEIDYSFASGLRSVVRQDPDIIMVGEIRDEETADLATHAALTGHLVLSTLHTNNAIGVVPRLVDMGIAPFLLPSSLNIALAQRLVRLLCVDCKKSYVPSIQIQQMIEKELAKIPAETFEGYNLKISKPFKLWKAQGCKFCANKGTKGRMPVFEVLSMTHELEKIIIEGPTENKLEEEARRQGMITMKQDGLLKALEGLMGLEEVLKTVES